jgi:hypothetical protein
MRSDRLAVVSAILALVAPACRQIAGYGGDDVIAVDDGDAPDGNPYDAPSTDSTADDSPSSGDASDDRSDGADALEAAVADAGHDASGDRDGGPPPECANPVDASGNIVPDPGFETANAGADWGGFAGAAFQVTTAAAHCGTHSGEGSGRTHGYQGPAFTFPSITASTYSVSAWVMQDGASDLPLLLNGVATCTPVPSDGGADAAASDAGPTTSYPFIGQATAHPSTWIQIQGLLSLPAGSTCSSLEMYLNQYNNVPATDAGPTYPNLYIDDVYISPQ